MKVRLTDPDMDYSLVFAVIILLAVSITMIHSTSAGEHMAYSYFWLKQLLWGVLSIVTMLAVALIPYKFFYAFSYIFYGLGMVLLVLTDLFGTVGGGSERWLVVAGFRIQPSEFMKIAVVLALARYLSLKANRPTTYKKCLIPFLIIALPMALVLQQPDLGTALVFGAIILPMLYWTGLDTLRLFFLIAPVISAVLAAPFIPFFNWVTWVAFMFVLVAVIYSSRYHFIAMGSILFVNILAGVTTPVVFNSLKPYQQKRITSVINPEADPRGAGWQVINSKIAIGSGGLFGKGIGKGRYTELGFLPRSHTDFIFSVVGEELGFIGAVGVLIVMFYIIYRGIMIASELRNPFMSTAAIGIATIFGFHMFINVGMVTGIMPVTGIPLPFLSYGGSACITNSILIGLLLNFRLNRHDY
jgi:rod shape determining protein RodA